MKLWFQACETMQIAPQVENKKRNGDSRSTVTVLSHTAITSLLTRNQRFKYKNVTGDSKFSFCNPIVREKKETYIFSNSILNSDLKESIINNYPTFILFFN